MKNILLTIFLLVAISSGTPLSAVESDPAAQRVRDAAVATYIHGMTGEIALREVGPEGLPFLLELLREPGFPRRDNVVAFLAYLGGQESTGELERFLETPPERLITPEEDRANLLAPVALGMIASRGEPEAVQLLLDWTTPQQDSRLPDGARRDRILMSLRGLAHSGSQEGFDRLQLLADRTTIPLSFGRTVTREAETALGLWAMLRDESITPAGAHGQPPPDQMPGSPQHIETNGSTGSYDGPQYPLMTGTLDSSLTAHEHRIDHANHVDLEHKVDDRDLDLILWEGSQRAGRGDLDRDVACCLRVTRGEPGAMFGDVGDGLNIIDNEEESNQVLGNSIARVKVVRTINYCGGPGTNIIGCAYTPGSSMAVVPGTTFDKAAILWIHEYGHNLGLLHVDDTRAIMYGTNFGINDLMSQGECDTFHEPHPFARATVSEDGSCNDSDDDSLQDFTDNCPTIHNENQSDSDQDFAGNDCDNCPINFNPDQADGDGDGDGDACDECTDLDDDGYGFPLSSGCPGGPEPDCDDGDPLANPGAMDYCDGNDSDCDGVADNSTCDMYDVDGDARAGGAELAWIGRAFAQCNANPQAEWWNAVDYNGDGCIDGDDLAILATAWNCQGTEPACY